MILNHRPGTFRKFYLAFPRDSHRGDPDRVPVMLRHVGQAEVHHIADVTPEMREVEIGLEHLGGVQPGAASPKKPSTAAMTAVQSSGDILSTAEGGTAASPAM